MSRKIEELKEKYGVTDKTLALMLRMDPTEDKKYLQWLFKVRYRKGANGKFFVSDSFPSTIQDKVLEGLTWFDKNLNGKVPKAYRDIFNFKDIEEFLLFITENKTDSRGELKSGVRVVMDTELFKIVTPLTFDASKIYGSGTKWCTTTKAHYDEYTSVGMLYYIMCKPLKRKFGVHLDFDHYDIYCLEYFNNEDDELSDDNMGVVFGESNMDKIRKALETDFDKYAIEHHMEGGMCNAIEEMSTYLWDYNINPTHEEVKELMFEWLKKELKK